MGGFFPLYVDLSEKKIVIVGGGHIAARRARKLEPFCDHIVVLSPEINADLQELLQVESSVTNQKLIHNASENSAQKLLHEESPVSDRGPKSDDKPHIRWLREPYTRERILDADIVLACTDDPKLNAEIYAACKCMGILVNDCSDRRKCDFYFPGIIRRENMVIGINASGVNHAEAKAVRQAIERTLDAPKN